MAGAIRLRKHLSAADLQPVAWPAGIERLPVAEADPDALHALLSDCYANGSGIVAPLETWWAETVMDEEYDPELVFVAVTPSGEVAGMLLCWNSGFIKDVAVASHMRGRGIGEALLRAAFATLQQRGFTQVDLKAMADNATAIRLYKRLGMVEAPL